MCVRVAGETLDVGCGDGELATLLKREGHRMAAADPARGGDLPFDDESFDTVLLGDFLAEWMNRERPVAEARRVLRPGGRLIVAVPYSPSPDWDGSGISLQNLLGELGGFAVGEVAIVDGKLCLLAERSLQENEAVVWQRVLGVAEERLVEREAAIVALSASVAELEERREGEERALADARRNVERLETALAAATHRRDLEQERARLAVDGIAELERLLERLQQDRDRERAEAERAGSDARSKLASRDAELARLRAISGEHERKLALSEVRLEKAQQRAEGFRRSLVALRKGRVYRLMRVLWRLRRPFRRAPRTTSSGVGVAIDEDPDSPAPASTPAPEPVPAPAEPEAPASPHSIALAERRPPPRSPGRLRVASILDEMSEACFAPECDLVPLALHSWPEQLDEHSPDLLLVESAWNGNGGEWQYLIGQYPRKDLAGLPALRALIDGCRERGIPTAFWNKEDPVHFERFAEAASLFDHIFTTDARCVERYLALPGERTVTPLPFAAQPRLHNPAAVVSERSASPCFAGAWYRDRHPDRRRALEALLDAARPYGLVIYDRSFDDNDGAFGFPERFAPHVLGQLPYDRILDVYRSHRVFLNANSVVDSPTMCSRRVFELAACDTPILSTPGAALSALLGEGMVEEAGDEGAAAAALERLLGDEGERVRRARAARRIVFAEHTYADRLETIAETAGIDVPSLHREPFAPPGASANGATASPNGGGDRHPWVLALQPGVALSEPALADLAAATAFADAGVIGACPARNGDAALEHRHVPDLDPRALLVRREVVEARGRPAGSAEQVRTRLREWGDDGVPLYAADADLLPA